MEKDTRCLRALLCLLTQLDFLHVCILADNVDRRNNFDHHRIAADNDYNELLCGTARHE